MPSAANPMLIILAAAALLLFQAGARLRWTTTQTILLATLLFVPDVVSTATLGLHVTWSSGLTWSNFVVPGLAIPMLAGAWWTGRWPAPRRWPPLAAGMALLLAWSLLTLLPPAAGGGLHPAGAVTIAAHAAKLALFLALGAILAAGDAAWVGRAARLLLAAIAVNAAVGLAQAAGWLAVFSPLADQAQGARATGLFYDANMYATLMAWALLGLLCCSPRGTRRWGWLLLLLAVAGSLVAAGSRAGYLALAVGAAVLVAAGQGRAVARAAVPLLLLALCFPLRSWQRIEAAAGSLTAFLAPPAVVTAAADASTREHLDSLRQAWLEFQRHPWLGVGFGRALYLGLPAPGDGPVTTGALFRGAQDMPLTVLAETGPLGLLLLLAAVLAPLARDPRLPLGLRAGYCGLLAASLTQETLWNARLLAIAVLVTGLAWQAARPPRERQPA
jgi:O-antigen ligase